MQLCTHPPVISDSVNPQHFSLFQEHEEESPLVCKKVRKLHNFFQKLQND